MLWNLNTCIYNIERQSNLCFKIQTRLKHVLLKIQQSSYKLRTNITISLIYNANTRLNQRLNFHQRLHEKTVKKKDTIEYTFIYERSISKNTLSFKVRLQNIRQKLQVGHFVSFSSVKQNSNFSLRSPYQSRYLECKFQSVDRFRWSIYGSADGGSSVEIAVEETRHWVRAWLLEEEDALEFPGLATLD